MGAISGAKTNAIVQISSTWGTAVAGGDGDKYVGEISHSMNISELTARAIGSGSSMISGATRGNEKPTVSLTGDAHYQGAFGAILSQFMGTDSVSSELTASQGDYRHTITFNTTLNAKYLTFAYESSSTTVHEFPSCAVSSLTIRTPQVPGYLEYQAELVANTLDLSTSTNTNAVCAAATLTDSEIIAQGFADSFWIDLQSSGALDSSDKLNILSYELKLDRPQESANEMKGSAGNGSPIATDLFSGTLTVTLKELVDHTYYTYWANETPLKARFTIEGSVIGTTTPKSLNCYIPRMQLIGEPVYGVASNGMNPVTYTFKLSKASANPTGMSSTYPYFELVNSLSTGYLA